MLSLAAGKTLGVAKNIDPIIVRMPRGAFSQDRYLDGLGKINDDLGTQPQSEAKATVLLAHYYPLDVLPSDGYQAWVNRFQTILTAMASKGAIIVTGSGNVRRGEGVINGWPANFGKSTGPVTIPSLIVAGALSPRGQETIYASDPQGGVPQIYAPGINVKVAEGNPNLGDSTRNSIGTSDGQFAQRVRSFAQRRIMRLTSEPSSHCNDYRTCCLLPATHPTGPAQGRCRKFGA